MTKILIHFFPKPSTEIFIIPPFIYVERYGLRQLGPFAAWLFPLTTVTGAGDQSGRRDEATEGKLQS